MCIRDRRVEPRAGNMRERRVALLQALDLGELVERGRVGAVEAERDRGVEDLLHGGGAEPELVGAPHLVDQLLRDDRAGLVVASEPRQRVVCLLYTSDA